MSFPIPGLPSSIDSNRFRYGWGTAAFEEVEFGVWLVRGVRDFKPQTTFRLGDLYDEPAQAKPISARESFWPRFGRHILGPS